MGSRSRRTVNTDRDDRAEATAEVTAEERRLDEDERRFRDWKRFGPYLSERQWGTVREDYSADGDAWRYFPHDHARSRAYRWGEDGLLGPLRPAGAPLLRASRCGTASIPFSRSASSA